MSKGPPTLRLDRLLANLGYGTRREVQGLVAAGLVKLDGAPLAAAFRGADAVAHLAHIGAERGSDTYEAVNVEGTRRVAAADPEAVTVAAVALLGFFTRHAQLPPPPGVPAVRAFQEAQRRVTQRWVEQRLG